MGAKRRETNIFALDDGVSRVGNTEQHAEHAPPLLSSSRRVCHRRERAHDTHARVTAQTAVAGRCRCVGPKRGRIAACERARKRRGGATHQRRVAVATRGVAEVNEQQRREIIVVSLATSIAAAAADRVRRKVGRRELERQNRERREKWCIRRPPAIQTSRSKPLLTEETGF